MILADKYLSFGTDGYDKSMELVKNNLAIVALVSLALAVVFLVAKAKPKPQTRAIFTRPRAKPYPDWSVETTKPLPYRPFKHNYFVTMGIRSMNWNEWIEMDNEWDKFHQAKLERLAAPNAKDLYGATPEAKIAAEELLEELSAYLPERYPSMFQPLEKGGVKNVHTGEEFSKPWKEDPVVICAKLIQDDFAIMIEGDDGQYYLRGGAIILAGFWRLKDKFNMPLSEIHTSGDVPQFKEKLEVSMMRFFRRMTPEKPVVRNNYFIQTDNELAWSKAIGPESSSNIGWYTASEVKDPKDLYFRSERQSLRRLPRTGAIIFTVRTYFIPMHELMLEPYVPKRLYDGIISWADDVSQYKGLEKYQAVLMPYLLESHQKQVEQGLVDAEEVQNYPF